MRYRVTILIAAALVATIAATAATGATKLLTGAGIQDNTLTSADIRNGTLTLRDFAPNLRKAINGGGSARTPQTVQGAVGPQGPPGPAGPAGPAGAPGGLDPSRITLVEGPWVTVSALDIDSLTVFCPPGQKATGGGFVFLSGGGTTAWSRPTPNGDGWMVGFDNFDIPISGDGNAYAVCVAP